MELTVNQRVLCYPPRVELGSLQTREYLLARGNELAHFCSTVKGERVLYPQWGLPHLIFQSNLSTGEIEAIILSNLSLFFPQTQFKVNCQESNRSLGFRIVDIFYTDPIGTGQIQIKI